VTKIVACALLLVLAAFAPLRVVAGHAPWVGPHLALPLGADEFGRNVLMVLVVSAGRSLVLGGALAAGTLGLSLALAYAVTRKGAGLLRNSVLGLSLVVEGIPLFMWVLLAFAVVTSHSLIAPAVALAVGVAPFASRILAGEIDRLEREPYVEAARLSGLSRLEILRRHVLPNAWPVTLPLFILVLGLGLAIPGAVGVLGVTRRADCDVGVLLLRGKENVAGHPGLLISTLVMLVVIYLCLELLRRPGERIARVSSPTPATLL
jgi:peptide/nickel transport system permease protein